MSPSPFVESWIADLAVRLKADTTEQRLRTRRALDVAMGRGRHTLLLARHGFQTFGVDINRDAVHDAMETAARAGLAVHGWCADLTVSPLPAGVFDLVVVTRYLQRDLFDAIKTSIRTGGCVIYETFTVAQLAHGVGPKSPDHLLKQGELQALFADWEELFYEEVDAPEAVARFVGRRASSA